MGFNFRKSISLIPGVKLNFSKGGASVSAGVPGFRKSINTKGQVTTTASIPGTGFYYTDKKKVLGKKSDKSGKDEKVKEKKEKTESKAKAETKPKRESKAAKPQAEQEQPAAVSQRTPQYTPPQRTASIPPYQPSGVSGAVMPGTSKQIDPAALKTIHKMADDTVEWLQIVNAPTPPDSSYNKEMWAYYYEAAPEVLNGDIDTYLRLIYEVNPLGDLLEYGSAFQFGTDDPDKMHVEFEVNKELLARSKRTLAAYAYNELLQDFICSLSIRIARDMFALLPVGHTLVHAMLDGQTVLSVDFDRDTLSSVRFGFIDPSDTMAKFLHHMSFYAQGGFAPVERLT